MPLLSGRVALVSGAAAGIGRACALRLADEGAALCLADLDGNGVAALRQQIESSGGHAIAVTLDVTEADDWDKAIEAVDTAFGRLDILVNNAGVFIGKDTETISLEEYHRMIAVNCDGVFLGTRQCLPLMKKTAAASPHMASVINISSGAGIIGLPMDPAYSMTKGGVRLFTKATALEFARKAYRIRVNSVHPGVVETAMGDNLVGAAASELGLASDNEAKMAVAMAHPIGRMAIPDDIANGVVFLASDQSSFMTGSELVIDGGVTAQ